VLRVLEYGGDREPAFREVAPAALGGAVRAGGAAPLVWVDVVNGQEEEILALADVLGWHRLVTEDVLHRGQRQKVEQYPGGVLSVIHYPRVRDGMHRPSEIELVQSERMLISLHGECVNEVDAMGREVGRRPDLAQNGATAAVAVLFAHVADQYERVIDELEEHVEAQEVESLQEATGDPAPALRSAADTRLAIARVRRASGQLREVIGVYVRRELVDMAHSAELDLELRDGLDHVVRAHEDLDVLHDRMSALAETRLALVAYRQNEITKALSAWAAILAVPTVVTGWFGQNFHHLGVVGFRYGEWFALLIILVGAAVLYVYFHARRWI
jgi:magnesium transporter